MATFGDRSDGILQVLTSMAVGQVSTYLVAYANGPFEYLESSYKSPLSGKIRPLRIYSKRAGDLGGGRHAELLL